MATKGSNHFFNAIFGSKEKDIYTATREEQQILERNRGNAANLIAKLKAINFADDTNKLSKDIIKEEDYEGIRRFAINELESPIEITRDVSALDKYLEQAVDALGSAVREGLPTAARWAAVALYQGLTSLRREVSEIDKPYEDDLYKQQLEYAANLEIIIKESLELDRRSQVLSKEQVRFQRQLDELLEKKTDLERRRRTPEGLAAVAEIRQFASEPIKMSSMAKALRQDLESYHILLANNKETEINIHVAETKIAEILRVVSSTKNRLAQTPVASDPLMQEKISRAMKVYQQNMLETLNGIASSRKIHDNYLSQMEMLSQHEVFRDDAARAIQTIELLNLEQRKETERQRQQYELIKKENERKKQERALVELLKQEAEAAYNELTAEDEIQEQDSEQNQIFNEMDPE